MRSIGMDVHRSFAQVTVFDRGKFTAEFRIELEHDAVAAFGQSLRKDDEVVLAATGNTSAIVRLLTPFVARVVIANPLQVKAIAHARVKTDKVDAKILAQLHAAGFLPEVWVADDETLNLRRFVSECAALVRSVRRVKSRVQALLHANLVPKYAGHLFGKGGRRWLSTAPLSKAERGLLAPSSRRTGLAERQAGEAGSCSGASFARRCAHAQADEHRWRQFRGRHGGDRRPRRHLPVPDARQAGELLRAHPTGAPVR